MPNLPTVNQILAALVTGGFQPAFQAVTVASTAMWAVGGLDATLYPVETAVIGIVEGWFVIVYQVPGGPGLSVDCALATAGAAFTLDTGVEGGWVAAY